MMKAVLFPDGWFNVLRWVGALLLWTASRSAVAQVTDTWSDLAISNYSGYLIAADEGAVPAASDRSAIAASVSVRFALAPLAGTTSFGYTAAFRLIDDSNNTPQPLQTAAGQETEVAITKSILLLNSGVRSRVDSFAALLRPAGELDPNHLYRVAVEFRYTDLVTGETLGRGATTETPARPYFHFRNTVSPDLALNFITRTESAKYDRLAYVQSAGDTTGFSVTATALVARYDDFTEPPRQDAVTFIWRVSVRDTSADTPVPLAQPELRTEIMLSSHHAAGGPATSALTGQLSLAPADGVTLDRSHLVQATVALLHLDLEGNEVLDGEQTLSEVKLLPLSGRLVFGDEADPNHVETRYTQLANDPTLDLVQVGGELATKLALASSSGLIVAKPSHRFGDPAAPLTVRLNAAGDAFVTGLSVAKVLPPSTPDRDEASGLVFERRAVTLSIIGAHAEGILLRFPAGFGVSGSANVRRLSGQHEFKDMFLNPSLAPRDDRTLEPGAVNGAAVFCAWERTPVWLVSNGLTWRVADGVLDLGLCETRYLAESELGRLESYAVQVPPVLADGSAANRFSNDHLYRSAKNSTAPVLLRSGPDGLARLETALEFNPGVFSSHFPRGVEIAWDGPGLLVFTNGVPDVAVSRLGSVHDIVVRYARNCPQGDCGAVAADAGVTFTPASGNLIMTCDGGLRATGTVAPHALEWGAIDSQTFAQTARDFVEAGFLMAGNCLGGEAGRSMRNEERPGGLLLSGLGRPGDDNYEERPETTSYDTEGAADYAGINFRVDSDGAQKGASRLTGQPTGDYPLTHYSKYYARPAGVSGVHDALMFPGAIRLYDFDTRLTAYSLSFLDSRNVDSRTAGEMDVPYPCAFTQEFERLRFGCRGQLQEAQVAEAGRGEKLLEYWTTAFRSLVIQFRQPGQAPCPPPTTGALAIGAKTRIPLINTPVFGTLGFMIRDPAGARLGDLTSASDKVGIDSRLEVPPAQLPIAGPGQSSYSFASIIRPYFNRYLPGAPREGGFVNLAGRLKAAFFESIPVHVQATPSLGTSGLFFMAGWEEPSGHTFFNDANFDPDNRGFPSAAGNAEAYRTSSAYRPHARRTWLDLVTFDFPVQWEGAVRKSFAAAGDGPANLRLVEVPSRLRHLSPTSAEIEFGSEIKELPRFSAMQLLGDVIDAHTGASRALGEALASAAKAAGITTAAERLDELTRSRLEALLDPPLAAAVDATGGMMDQLYAKLVEAYADGTKPLATFQADFCTALNDSFLDGQLDLALARLFAGAEGAQGLLQGLQNNLRQARDGIGSLRDVVKPDGSGQHPVVGTLAFKLSRSELASALLQQLTQASVQEYIEQLGPTFNEINGILGELEAALADAEGELAPAGGELSAALQQVTLANAQLQQLRNRFRQSLCDEVKRLSFTPERLLLEYSPAQLKQRLRQALLAEFYSSFVPERIALVLRARFSDSRAAFRQALDAVFGQVNRALRDALLQQFGDEVLPDDVERGLGTLGSSFEGAKLSGYARINGDSLEEARVDGKLGLSLEDPKKPFGFEGWILVSNRKSDRPGAACRDPGARATTIAVGAILSAVVGYGQNQDGTGVRASVDLGVALSPSSKLPLGLDGAVGIAGDFPVGDLNLKDAALKFAAGDGGNYLAGVVHGQLNGIEADIRAFIGQSCDVGALKIVDPSVQKVLDLPDYKPHLVNGPKPGSLIGFYVAADGAFPLEKLLGLPSTCVLSLRALGGNAWFGFLVDQGPGKEPALLVGRRQSFGLHGRVLCAIEVKGELDLVGAIGLIPSGKQIAGFLPDITAQVTIEGHGRIEGKFGICPACFKASKDVTVLLHLTPAIGPPPVFVRFSKICYEVDVDDVIGFGGCLQE